ncbi:hypothetical protein HAX54_030011, partial [Datura stramonium]|nr:hypothetical protein [Datura stramonium]
MAGFCLGRGNIICGSNITKRGATCHLPTLGRGADHGAQPLWPPGLGLPCLMTRSCSPQKPSTGST